jgi:hypothetical protein
MHAWKKVETEFAVSNTLVHEALEFMSLGDSMNADPTPLSSPDLTPRHTPFAAQQAVEVGGPVSHQQCPNRTAGADWRPMLEIIRGEKKKVAANRASARKSGDKASTRKNSNGSQGRVGRRSKSVNVH